MAIKRILINATYSNAIRIAYTQGSQLSGFEIEQVGQESALRNIYKGKVQAINTSLECAFVDIGIERQGMLSFKRSANKDLSESDSDSDQANLATQLREGQQILVQVDKEPRGTKGAALSTQVSIAGRNVVLKPGSPTRTISRAVQNSSRSRLENITANLKIPDNHGIILRTSARDAKQNDIQQEVDHLVHLWGAIKKAQDNVAVVAPSLIYRDNDLIHRLFRDKFHRDVTEMQIDDERFYHLAVKHAKEFYPDLVPKIKRYSDKKPIFDRFVVEQKIAACYEREVSLPSGGSISIDPTEALTSVDVNSYRTRGHGSFADTALITNLEAAEELVKQLIFRDLGGLIVVDFIDMDDAQSKKVEQKVEEMLSQDRANTNFCPISEFGLMEIQRQRIGRSIYDTDFKECPTCSGMGMVRSTYSSVWQIIRRLEQILMSNGGTSGTSVDVRLPHDVGMELQNKESESLAQLESMTGVSIRLQPNRSLDMTDTKFTVYYGERNQQGTQVVTHGLHRNGSNEYQNRGAPTPPKPQEPIVTLTSVSSKSEQKSTQKPRKRSRRRSSVKQTLLARVWAKLLSLFGVETQKTKKGQKSRNKKAGSRSKQNRTENAGRRSENGKRSSKQRNSKQNGRNKSQASSPKNAQKSKSQKREQTNANSQKKPSQPKQARSPRKESEVAKSNSRQASGNQRRGNQAQSQEQNRSSKDSDLKENANDSKRVSEKGQSQTTKRSARPKRSNDRPRANRSKKAEQPKEESVHEVESANVGKKQTREQRSQQQSKQAESTVADHSQDRPRTHPDLLNTHADEQPKTKGTDGDTSSKRAVQPRKAKSESVNQSVPAEQPQSSPKQKSVDSEQVQQPKPVANKSPSIVRAANDPRARRKKQAG